MRTAVLATSLALALLAGNPALGNPAAADEPYYAARQAPPSGAVRSDRPWSVNVHFDGIFARGGGAPLGGLDISRNLGPHVAIGVSWSTLGIFNLVDGVVRVYMLRSIVSPYGYARAGATILSIEGTSTTFIAAAGGGVEVALRGGFSTSIELGAATISGTWGGRTVIGFGYRF